MGSRRASKATSTAQRSATRHRPRRHNAPRAYVPGAAPRKTAKVLDAGARVESELETLINGRKVRVDCWRRPGVRYSRLSGVMYYPDAACYIDELSALVAEQTPQIAGRPRYNALIEFKGQTTTGSAEKKITAAIEDLAHACDELGVVGAVILKTPALTERQRYCYKLLGRQHSVVVLEEDELDHETLVGELLRVAKERRRLLRRVGPAGGYVPTKRPPTYEKGFAYRVATRGINGRRIRRYGSTAASCVR